MKLDLPYLSEETDRHDNVKLYVRRNGKRVRLTLLPTANGFMEEYQGALAKLGENAKPKPGDGIGTIGWLVNEFEHSHNFQKLASREQANRHNIVASALDEETKAGSGKRFRDCPISAFTADHDRLLRDRKKDKPGGANNRIKHLRIILAWGMEEKSKWVKKNVAADVKTLKYAAEEFHTWGEDEVAAYEARHLRGTMARLALDLLLFTGARRSDAIKLGPKHLSEIKHPTTKTPETWVVFKPNKTSTSTGKVLTLPVLDVLRESLAATPHGIETFLVTIYGKPFASGNSFGNWFKDRCAEAGLPPECMPHGLRKVGAVRAVENGATEQQMMAIIGWDTPKLAALYAKKANQKKMAGAAMGKLIGSA